jgi:hypothetical protein
VERAYRWLAGLIAVAIAAAAACVLVVAIRILEPAQLSLGVAAIESWLTDLAQAPLAIRAGFAAGSSVVGLLSLMIAMRAFGPRRRGRESMHILESDDRGFVVVDSRGIAIVAEEAAHTTPGVVAAEVEVFPRGAKGVKLRVEIDVYPGANIKQAGTEARERARKAVEELVGVEVGAVTASTHVLEPEEMARVLL